MKKTIVIAPGLPKDLANFIDIKNSYIICCDGALDVLSKENIKPDLVVGDFDSLKNKNLLKGLKKIKLPIEKDVSDTNYALSLAFKNSNNVTLIGGLKGNRIDHLYANLLLLNKYPKLTIIDDTNKVFLLEKGSYNINSLEYEYISFFSLTESLITLEGFKYNINNYNLKIDDPLCLSNNQIKKNAKINISKGKILVIMSKD